MGSALLQPEGPGDRVKQVGLVGHAHHADRLRPLRRDSIALAVMLTSASVNGTVSCDVRMSASSARIIIVRHDILVATA
jgi:hypothetical protein